MRWVGLNARSTGRRWRKGFFIGHGSGSNGLRGRCEKPSMSWHCSKNLNISRFRQYPAPLPPRCSSYMLRKCADPCLLVSSPLYSYKLSAVSLPVTRFKLQKHFGLTTAARPRPDMCLNGLIVPCKKKSIGNSYKCPS